MPENTTADHNNLPDKRALLRKAALEYHEFPKPGKISIAATKQMVNQHDLALAYSPGVAAPCEEIVKDPNAAFKYTSRGNLVGVVTNGTAVLGLVDTVMEGHAAYLDHWLKVLKSDKSAIFTAAKQAGLAHEFIMSKAEQARQAQAQ